MIAVLDCAGVKMEDLLAILPFFRLKKMENLWGIGENSVQLGLPSWDI